MEETHKGIQYENLLTFWDDFLNQYCREEIAKLELEYPIKKSINVNWSDLSFFNKDFADNLLFFPKETLNAGKTKLTERVDIEEEVFIRVRGLNPESKVQIREIRESNLNKFIAVEGLVRKTTDVRPRIKIAKFRCLRCGSITEIEQDGLILKEPLECSKEKGGCGKNVNQTSFKLLTEESKFIDNQRIEIQEYPEELKGGAQPQRIYGYCEADITGKILPGDRVVLNGILRSLTMHQQKRKLTLFDIFLEIDSYEIKEQEFEEIEITEEDKKKILALSKEELIYEKIIGSIAPSIHGLKMEKQTLALQLFGGLPKSLPDKTNIRGDIHILLVGDPGTAKSQLLNFISKLALRGIYASGKSSSAAGLTAAVMREDSLLGEGRYVLEAGALVLADRGTACVDEMDKMNKEDRSAMHESMEQQTISIAKAGITATLHSRCSVLGAANPKLGRFEEGPPIALQIDMPPTLLSRFDAIFTITDKPDAKKDEEMAEHILRIHLFGQEQMRKRIDRHGEGDLVVPDIKPMISVEDLRKYIAYAKKNCFPRLMKEAFDRIKDYYVDLRKTAGKEDAPMPITPRQLESFVRLAEASARMRLGEEITIRDAERAINIMEYCLNRVAFDFETGKVDIDKLTSGITHAQRDRTVIIRKIIEDLSAKGDATLEEILTKAEEKGIDREKAEGTLKRLKDIEWYCPRYGVYRLVK